MNPLYVQPNFFCVIILAIAMQFCHCMFFIDELLLFKISYAIFLQNNFLNFLLIVFKLEVINAAL